MTATPASSVPPAGLRGRILAASLGARAPGRSTPGPEPIAPVEALRRSADALGALLATLAEPQWRRPALRGLAVQGLIGHLIGVEADVQRALLGDAAVAGADHIAGTQPAADRQHGRRPELTRQEWVAAVARTLDLAAAADPGAVVAVHGVRMPAPALCVARTFELWTHENDIRRATGRPGSSPDASTLALMSRLAVRVLPVIAPRTGLDDGVLLRLVLTGPGGGTWQVPIGGRSDRLAVGIVTDVVGFCRLVANRVSPAELDRHVIGDEAAATAVLQAATTLALD
jgi:uncharacterized protein (TIGR03083 family)